MSGWLPISAAPVDGTLVLLACAADQPGCAAKAVWLGRWRHEQVFVNGALREETMGWFPNPGAHEPTHCQLLEPLPEVAHG